MLMDEERKKRRREYACAALTGLLANPGSNCHGYAHSMEDAARHAFAIADEMIKKENEANV